MNTLYDFDTISPYDPLLSRIYPDGKPMTDIEVTESWRSLRDVSEEVYLLLSSRLIAEKSYEMMKKLQLTEEVSMRIVSLLRMYYFGKAPLDQLPSLLKNDVSLPQEKVVEVMTFIQKEILSLKAPKETEESDEVAPMMNALSLQILQALEKFPRINDQQITSERIRVRSERESVRGSVRNWLRAYRDALGARQHTAIERGQFLFQAENAKNLPTQERERVSLILKSLDDGELLTVNPEKQEIIFPVAATAPQPSQGSLSTILQQHRAAPPQSAPQKAPVAPQPDMSRPQQQPVPVPQPRAAVVPQEKSPASPASGMKTFNFSAAASAASIVPFSNDFPDSDPFRFSSGHTLPAEKRAPVSQPAQAPAQKKEVWQVPASLQNVVDLRPEE